MELTNFKNYQTFCDNTKHTFFLNIFAIIFIFFFILGPYKLSGISNKIIKIIIISLLSYSLYINIISSNLLLNTKNLFVDPSLAIIKNNCLLNMLFCIVLIIFISTIISTFVY